MFITRIKINNLINLTREILASDLFDSIDSLEECDVLLFSHDVDRSLNLSGKAYSTLIDSVREDFENRGLTCISIAHPWSTLTGNKAHGDPASFNLAYLRCCLLNRLFQFFGMNKDNLKNLYLKILQRTKVKIIITIGSPKYLSLAARECGVFHIELLHGIGYKSIQWGWSDLPKEYLPQCILSLDAASTIAFAPLKDKGIEIFTIPHPFLKRFYLDKLYSLPSEWVVNQSYSKKFTKHILISINWGYSGDHGADIEFANILSNGLFYDEIGELVGEEADIFWHFRFHPVQLRMKRYKKLLDFMDEFVLEHPNAEWTEASRVPFSSIAMHCDGNIGMSSMSFYDAAAMGLPSLILCPTTQKGGIYQNWFDDLESEGYVTKTEVNKEMLRNWVHETHKIEPRLSNLEDESAWETAVESILRITGLDQPINHQSLK